MDQSLHVLSSNETDFHPMILLPLITGVLRTGMAGSAYRRSLPFGAPFLDGRLVVLRGGFLPDWPVL